MAIKSLRLKNRVSQRKKTNAGKKSRLPADSAILEKGIAQTEDIIAAIGDAISIQSTDFKVLYQNRAHKSLVGDQKGKYCYKAYEHRNKVCGGCPLEMSFRDGKIHTRERNTIIGNEPKCFEITASPMKNAAGKIVAGIEAARDVTVRKNAEKALKESEEKYRILVENSQSGVFIIQDSKVQFVNESFAKMCGYAVKEVVGQDFRKFVAPEDLKMVADRYRRRQAGEKLPSEYEFRMLHKDRRRILVNMDVGLINYRGRVASTGTVKDITTYKSAEKDLLKFKRGLELSNDAVFITGIDGAIVYINPAFTKTYGYTEKEALGKTPRIIKSGLIPKKQYKQFWDTLLEKKTVSGEIVNKTKDGRMLSIEASDNPILDAEGNILGFLAIHRDITERKETEEKMKKLNQDLESKVYELERFNKLTVGRELKMIELKKRIAELEGKK